MSPSGTIRREPEADKLGKSVTTEPIVVENTDLPSERRKPESTPPRLTSQTTPPAMIGGPAAKPVTDHRTWIWAAGVTSMARRLV